MSASVRTVPGPRPVAGEAPGTRGGVVVGVDGSPGSRRALEEAFRAAVARGVPLRVVAVYEPPEWSWGLPPAGTGLPLPSRLEIEDAMLEGVDRLITEVGYELGGELGRRPPIDVEVHPGLPAEVLLDAAREADALVVGHRGRGAVTSTLLGSVGLRCVLRAPCSVTVVPARS